MIKGLIFDLDGTLSNRQKSMYLLAGYMVEKIFPDLKGMEKEARIQYYLYCDMYGFTNFDYTYRLFAQKYGLDFADFKAKMEVYWLEMKRFITAKEETAEVLKELKKRGYKVAILTSGKINVQYMKAENMGIRELVDDMLVSTETPYHKPQKEIFQLMAERLDLASEECAYIGDNFASDILGAHNAGMFPVYIWSDPQRKMGMEVARIQDLRELYSLFKGSDFTITR